MNEFENKLREIKPAAPSQALMRKLRETRPVPKERWDWHAWLFRVALPVTALVAVAVIHYWPKPVPEAVAPPVAKYEAVESQDFILGAKQVGIARTENGVPYRVVQCVGVQRQTWKKTSDGSEVAVVVPQQQIILAKMDVY